MTSSLADRLFTETPFWPFGLAVLLLLLAATELGRRTRLHRSANIVSSEADTSQEGYVVSAVLGLLALLLGFTFALAVDRYDTRRAQVIEEANAIGTTFLRAQTFDEPHRSRLGHLLYRYVDNRLVLAGSISRGEAQRQLVVNDQLLDQMWQATVAALENKRDVVASAFMESMNATIDVAAARKASRRAHVPTRVLAVLLIYMTISAGVLGHVAGPKRRGIVLILQFLLTLAFLLIIDIDRPTGGRVIESQVPMEELKASIAAQLATSAR